RATTTCAAHARHRDLRRVAHPPPPTSYSSSVSAPILLYIGFHPPCTAIGSNLLPPCNSGAASYTPLMCPSPASTTPIPTSSPRLFRDPSSSPPTDAASNHSFAFDFTTSVSLFSKLGDPITGQ